MFKTTERLFLTADGKRLVPEGSKDAATLYCIPGDEIRDPAAERFGLKKPEDKKAGK